MEIEIVNLGRKQKASTLQVVQSLKKLKNMVLLNSTKPRRLW